MRDDDPVMIVSAEEAAARPVDVVTMRRTCEVGLRWVPDHDLELLHDQLLGHVRELVIAVERLLLGARGESALLMQLCLQRARTVLNEEPGTTVHVQAAHVYDLATVCRPLLSLCEKAQAAQRR
ncbi:MULTISPECIES: DUF6415 family natural product biosynthesis protein [Streptomyces]|uniref:DUF6415 family natural product biosynthesis protein n=1 Tax=Streptomyces TaxID=1883 RepID=UPI0029A4DF01|nr:DUF6415 family natural product biosynthesis protein [Streptomyces sp. ME02-6978.2a]MDX3360578.1 DUF6415 family natural product biosynthesis protein [Streptomyces sp. ME02-6978.2a]